MMDQGLVLARKCLTIVGAIGLVGTAFSGALAARELFAGASACPAASATMFGVPVCVYGLAMFAAIATIAFWGLLGSSGSVRQRER